MQWFHGETAQSGGKGSKPKIKVTKRENVSLVCIHQEEGAVGAHVGVKKFLFSKSALCCSVSLTPTNLLVSRLKMSQRRNTIH